MLVADTSVWIDLLKGNSTPQSDFLRVNLEERRADFALTDIVFTELLQGVRDDGQASKLEERLSEFPVLRLEGLDDFRRAAGIHRAARRRGQAIRRTSDCLIASVCIRDELPLLHSDADFDRIASVSELTIVGPLV